ncbi:hypothetical protein [Nocardioides plantarum]|uniref:Uncharacterized protein n=1 Tax=Nocardioides plantarum TaxID=29299 RepID=A0ABV5K704_9ACTN|nr:hypothetical protein [Nocardioides plantarum]
MTLAHPVTRVDAADPTCTTLDEGLRVRGVMILSIFAVVWTVVAASGLSETDASAGAIPTVVVGVLVALALIVTARRKAHDPVIARVRHLPTWWSRGVGAVNIGQVVVILAAVIGLSRADQTAYIPAAVAVVVGLHFLPLATAFDQPQYRTTALLLVLVGLAGAGLVLAGAENVVVQAAVGYASAVALWASAAHVATRN